MRRDRRHPKLIEIAGRSALERELARRGAPATRTLRPRPPAVPPEVVERITADAEAAPPGVAGRELTITREDGTEVPFAAVLAETEGGLTGAVAGVLERYNEAERDLLDGYPPARPGAGPLTDADAKRVMTLLGQLPHLSPAELVGGLTEALARYDHPVVDALLPIARSRRGRPEYEELGAGLEANPLDEAIALAEMLVTTTRDGWRAAAREEALRVAARYRAQVERVAEAYLDAEQVPLVRRVGDGRLGIAPDLDPPPGIEAADERFVSATFVAPDVTQPPEPIA